MKKLFILLLILPELILSQSISISGSSNQNNGTTLLPLENGEFIPSKIQGRNSNIGIYYNQSVSLPIGYYTLLVGAEYNNNKINYDFYEIKPGYYDFEYIDHENIAHPQLGELSVLEATANTGTDGGIFNSASDGEDVYIDLILLSSGPIIETYNYFTIASTLNY